MKKEPQQARSTTEEPEPVIDYISSMSQTAWMSPTKEEAKPRDAEDWTAREVGGRKESKF